MEASLAGLPDAACGRKERGGRHLTVETAGSRRRAQGKLFSLRRRFFVVLYHGAWIMELPAGGVYQRRHPRRSPLYRLFSRHWETFVSVYEERFACRYGPLRPCVRKSVDEYLRCGIFDYGFARVRCGDCGHDCLVAFSCKRRGLCPSCHKKRQLLFGEMLTCEVLEPVGHRHITFSIPRRLRLCFRYNRKLLSRLACAAYDALLTAMQEAAGESQSRPGAVASVQTFGSLLDFHPHVHMVITWGLFDSRGEYTGMPEVSEDFGQAVEALFRHRVFRLLLKEGAITEDIVENMLSWRHSGFHIHTGRMIGGNDKKALESLGEYLVRGPVSLERLSVSDDQCRVILDGGKHHPRHGARHRIWDPLEFIGQMCSHIPNTHEKTVIYYGHYSHRARGERKKRIPKSEAERAMAKEEKTPEHVRANWARLIQKVFEVDPLICPKCGGQMRVISFIEEEDVIFRILSHLGMLEKDREETEARGPPDIVYDFEYAQAAPDEDLVAVSEFEEFLER